MPRGSAPPRGRIDFGDLDAIPAVVEPIVELDVLIHNAGVAYPGRVAETSVEEWQTTMQVNVIGAVALTLPLLPALRSAGGHVVFINSGAGINASPGLASYTSSKFALRGFADSLRDDEPSLRVTSVFPGRIATVMQEGLIDYEGREYAPVTVPQSGDRRKGDGRRRERAARMPTSMRSSSVRGDCGGSIADTAERFFDACETGKGGTAASSCHRAGFHEPGRTLA